jgi:hypothetical protein
MEVLPPEFEALYDQCTRTSKTPDESSLITLADVCLGHFSSTFLLLDALDECRSMELRRLVIWVRELRKRATKVLCTCRPHTAHFEKQLEATSNLEISAHDDDIRNYLAFKMDEEWGLSERLRVKAIEELVKGAKGMCASFPELSHMC